MASTFNWSQYLVPEGVWLRRTGLCFAFILLDYFSTIAFCTSPGMEGNVYARGLMEACGVYLGSTIFCVLRSFPIYLVLCLDSYFVRLPERWLGITGLFLDLVFAWFTAGSHFRAATSWFWEAPGTLRQALGFSVYISAAVFWLRG